MHGGEGGKGGELCGLLEGGEVGVAGYGGHAFDAGDDVGEPAVFPDELGGDFGEA